MCCTAPNAGPGQDLQKARRQQPRLGGTELADGKGASGSGTDGYLGPAHDPTSVTLSADQAAHRLIVRSPRPHRAGHVTSPPGDVSTETISGYTVVRSKTDGCRSAGTARGTTRPTQRPPASPAFPTQDLPRRPSTVLREARRGAIVSRHSATLSLPASWSAEESVHDLGAAAQFGHDYLPVDRLGRGRTPVPDQVRDVLKRRPVRAE
jgi:hypothetical protein